MDSENQLINLKDFVSSTIIEIMEGVKEAQKFAQNNDAVVSPIDSKRTEEIEFDLEVSTTKTDGAKGGISVVAWKLFKVGAEGEIGTNQMSTNRIKFKIPIRLPYQPGDVTGRVLTQRS